WPLAGLSGLDWLESDQGSRKGDTSNLKFEIWIPQIEVASQHETPQDMTLVPENHTIATDDESHSPMPARRLRPAQPDVLAQGAGAHRQGGSSPDSHAYRLRRLR